MTRFRGSEGFYQLGNDSAGQGAARDDGRELPPPRRIAAKNGNNDGRNGIGKSDRNEGSDPHQPGERGFEIHLLSVAVAALLNDAVDEVGYCAGDQHDNAHYEDPDEQLYLNRRTLHCQEDEGDKCDASDAVRFKAVCGWADGISSVVTGTISNNAGVARIVFFNLEHDFHQVGTDVGDFGEDTARDPKRGRAERLAYGESNEARSSVVSRDEEKNDEHHQEFHAD